ncbi:MAG: alcohol dehydrogenase catalytic domain-containing protein [Firmicutes bacterium]|nr:alcohol dehydrogenase catalytic domain-containing protein [Bacillota bacterium]
MEREGAGSVGTMTAVEVRAGPPRALVAVRRPVPVPGPGEVRVRVAYCGVNHLDRMIAEGTLPTDVALPRVPGGEVAGTVDAVGEGVAEVAVGDAVVIAPYLFCGRCDSCRAGRETLCRRGDILGLGRDGGYAEYVVAPAANALPIPPSLPLDVAAALPLAAATALHMLVDRARLRVGEWVLVMGVGGGVASAALRLANLMGARVIAASRSEAKLRQAERDGAAAVVAVTPPGTDLPRTVRRITGGAGADVVVDPLGGAYWAADLASLARGGRLVTCGAFAGREGGTDIWLTFAKELEILGSYGASRRNVAEVVALAARGAFRPAVADRLPLADAAEAHARLRRGEVYGKILLSPG